MGGGGGDGWMDGCINVNVIVEEDGLRGAPRGKEKEKGQREKAGERLWGMGMGFCN